MKKLLFLVLLSGCMTKELPKDWIIVGKEYRQGGKCHDNNRIVKMYMGVVVVPHVPVHIHKIYPSEFIVYLGRPNESSCIHVDSLSFYEKYPIGSKISR